MMIPGGYENTRMNVSLLIQNKNVRIPVIILRSKLNSGFSEALCNEILNKVTNHSVTVRWALAEVLRDWEGPSDLN